MPNTASARKNMRKDVKRRLRNRAAKSTLKNTLKKYRSTVDTGEAATINTGLADVAKKFDQAASKDIIHKNKANRIKSRMAKLANKKTAAAAPAS